MSMFKVFKVGLILKDNTDMMSEWFSEVWRGADPQKVIYDTSADPQLVIEADLHTLTKAEEFVEELRGYYSRPTVDLVLTEVDPEYDWQSLNHQIRVVKDK